MEFFNKKEEVIELKLTQFGRFTTARKQAFTNYKMKAKLEYKKHQR